jgi:hypothetical protein
MPSADEFRKELYRMLSEATKGGRAFVEINAGELHRRVGDYPSKNHRMPMYTELPRASGPG